jgi:hypothetical protein
MTAPNQCCINVKKLLSIRRRPHKTLSRHSSQPSGIPPPSSHNVAHLDYPDSCAGVAATSYVVIVPLLMIVIPPIQHFVMRQAGLPTR